MFSGADRGDDRNEFVFIQGVDDHRVNPNDFSYQADVDDLRGLPIGRHRHAHLARPDETAILAAQADRHPAMAVDETDDLLVDFTCQDHLDNVHGLLVRNSHASYELGGSPHLLQHFIDLRTATMNHHGIDPDIF